MVGAGVIGSGVAQLFAQTGHDVVLVDVRDEPLESARRAIAKNLKMAALLRQEHLDPAAVLARLQTARDITALAGTDFVIENVTEDWELKRHVHGEIHAVVSPDAPIAANTSAIPITRIASAGSAAHRVVGMHFMNPPPLMPMVEIIRGVHTSDDTVAAAQALAAQAGRQSIVVNDSPGFVTNRVMMLMVNEAMFLVHEGVIGVVCARLRTAERPRLERPRDVAASAAPERGVHGCPATAYGRARTCATLGRTSHAGGRNR